MHPARQVLHIGFAAHHEIGCKYEPVLAIPMCLKDHTCALQVNVLQPVIDTWFKVDISCGEAASFSQNHGPINDIASDGDGPR